MGQGHAGDAGNEFVDEMLNKAMDRMQQASLQPMSLDRAGRPAKTFPLSIALNGDGTFAKQKQATQTCASRR